SDPSEHPANSRPIRVRMEASGTSSLAARHQGARGDRRPSAARLTTPNLSWKDAEPRGGRERGLRGFDSRRAEAPEAPALPASSSALLRVPRVSAVRSFFSENPRVTRRLQEGMAQG